MSCIRGNIVSDTNAGHFSNVMASSINNTENLINPLMLELNRSAQSCLPGFFTGDFNF
jgi:hypothetical protein